MTEYAQLRGAYELGRLRTSLRRALYVVVPLAVLAAVVTGSTALAWIPVTLAAWVFANWRGAALLRGAWFGLAGGIITYVLPMSVLRPCCTPEAMSRAMAAGEDCCTKPAACLVAGAMVGFALAALVPSGGARWRTAGGMAIGVASVAVLKCATLFAGEAVGLVGGIVAGVLAGAMANLALGRRAHASR